jgi:hypothetical protein
VTTPGGTGTESGLYTYVASPSVTSIAPNSGPTQGGTSVTITGANFAGRHGVDVRRGGSDGQEAVNATTIRRWGRRTQPELSMSR